jgi:trehalose 6-phosphate synthase
LARLVIVSNRVATPGDRSGRAGGLAVAMRDALRRHGGVWFGWSGQIDDAPASAPHRVTAGGVTYVTVDLTASEHERYYVGYANRTLWPLLHFRLGLVEYKREEFEAYLEVNARFAEVLAPLLQPDDLVWTHDYHLIPLGAELRKRGVKNRLGFFLHTPFPSADVLVALPHHETLMRSLCAYDLVGFQTDDAVRAFLDYIVTVAQGSLLDGGEFQAFGTRSRAARFPVGIDTDGFAELARQSLGSADAIRLKQSLADRRLVIGVDRLDYSKGIPSRFEAIDSLLTRWPDHRRTFNYLQITPHSRAEVAQYRSLRREIESAAGRINGRFAEFDWSPIRYVNRSFTRATLAGFYRQARAGLVTPFRDGMNLVAKEFVAAQNPDDPGVLILSRLAGAAKELDTALLVNPLDYDEMAAALHLALAMSLEERRERWQPMMATLRRNTVATWRENYLAALQRTDALPARRAQTGD